MWLAFPLNLRVFCLHGRALLATGLVSACGLATTLGIVIHCNTAIRPNSIYYALVACGVKYACLLATTLGIAVCCNTVIRPESVNFALVTHGQVFIHCLANPRYSHLLRHNHQIRVITVRWQLLDFCPFVTLASDKGWSRPSDRNPRTKYLQPSV